MEQKYNEITFFSKNYIERHKETGEEYVDECARYRDIAEVIRILIKNNMKMKIWSDEMTVVIEYNHAKPSLSNADLEWIGEDEYIGSYNEDAEVVENADESYQ